MSKILLLAAACVVLGAALGNSVARYVAQQHRHTRAVMTLAQFHLDRLSASVRSGDCAAFNAERGRLSRVYDELLQAFPLVYAQDAEFHTRADALGKAIAAAVNGGGVCNNAGAAEKSIRDACDDCHHEYR